VTLEYIKIFTMKLYCVADDRKVADDAVTSSIDVNVEGEF
jgi:hypothetical protein